LFSYANMFLFFTQIGLKSFFFLSQTDMKHAILKTFMNTK